MASRLLCLLVIACLAVSVLSLAVEPVNNNNNTRNTFPNLRKIFNSWKGNHGRSYESVEEEEKRFAVFRANLKFIREHNRKTSGFRMGLNEFSDLSNQEFRARMNGLKPDLEAHAAHPNVFVRDPNFAPPSSMDWRQQGAVTGVKNQGQCGGCWSFSTTGSIEGAWAIAGNQLVGLSEQNLLDCSTNGGNDGCQGGLMTAAFQYVISNNGIDTEVSYPYQAEGPLTCRYKVANKGASIDSYGTVSQGSEADLESATATIGPISVAIDASHQSFQNYQSGVYYEPACSSTNLDHGVLVVGYGSTGGQDYWIVKNSWGTTWGIQGYIWMSRNRNNNCGIATMASYPIIKGGSSSGGSGGSGGSTSGYSSGYSSGNYDA